MIRKNEAMYSLFGKEEGKHCKDCPYLVRKEFGRVYYKCEIYSTSNSEASDWRKSWTACGLFYNTDALNEFKAHYDTVMDYLTTHRLRAPEKPVEGQIRMEGI